MSRVGIAHHPSAITVGGAHPTTTFSLSCVSPRLMRGHPKNYRTTWLISNIGSNIESTTKSTTTPMNSTIIGSSSAVRPEMVVSTSLSYVSDTLASIPSSSPLFSPAVLICITMDGNAPLLLNGSDNGSPSLTRSFASSIIFDNTVLFTTAFTISIELIRGMPLARSVLNVLENLDMAMSRTNFPKSGARSITLSYTFLPLGVFTYFTSENITMKIPPARSHQYDLKKLLIAIRIIVGSGNAWTISSNTFVT